jgi:hypothetical protein
VPSSVESLCDKKCKVAKNIFGSIIIDDYDDDEEDYPLSPRVDCVESADTYAVDLHL